MFRPRFIHYRLTKFVYMADIFVNNMHTENKVMES